MTGEIKRHPNDRRLLKTPSAYQLHSKDLLVLISPGNYKTTLALSDRKAREPGAPEKRLRLAGIA